MATMCGFGTSALNAFNGRKSLNKKMHSNGAFFCSGHLISENHCHICFVIIREKRWITQKGYWNSFFNLEDRTEGTALLTIESFCLWYFPLASIWWRRRSGRNCCGGKPTIYLPARSQNSLWTSSRPCITGSKCITTATNNSRNCVRNRSVNLIHLFPLP